MLRVVTYHRIAEVSAAPSLDPTLVSATPESFRKQMQHLRRWYRPVSLDEIAEAFETRRPLPSRSVHVTVDDAYRDFREVAWPILSELDIPVSVFIPTAYPDRSDRSFWWDRLHRVGTTRPGDEWRDRIHQAARTETLRLPPGVAPDVRALLRLIPHDEMEHLVNEMTSEIDRVAAQAVPSVMGWDELRSLQSEGVTFGTHTRNHVALSRVDDERVRSEVRSSLEDLARELGAGPRAIAYPYGMCNGEVARVAREEGCVLGFTGEDGLNHPARTDPLRLRRSNITPRTSPALFTVRMLPWCAHVDRWRHRHERTILVS
jgi:peptidoglycan/xylan/chitin deacetylase (PgdA/CDA1 family)